MTSNSNGWLQTASILLAVVAASVSTVLWITKQNNTLAERIVRIDFELAELRARVAAGGWSFRQHMLWIEQLRTEANHEIPSPADFPPLHSPRRQIVP